MDVELFQGLIAEAQSYLPSIREGISDFCLDATALESLKEAKRQIHTVKGAASMIGLSEISEMCLTLENDIKPFIENPRAVTDDEAENLFGQFTTIEIFLNTIAEKFADMSIQPDVFDEGLLDISDSNSSPKTDSFEDFEDFEIDDEMLEVFAMEADDHLQNIGANLTYLEKNPNNREALLEIRRSSHTLKGSAGIVGLKKLSTLAHRMEDLLDFLADNEIEGNTTIFELLLASTDCLDALTKNQQSAELEQKISELYQRFDVLMASLQQPEAQQISAVSDSESFAEQITPSQVIIAQTDSAPIEEESAETAENHIQTVNNRSVIRVSIERLDDLVKLVSEMVISRSFFEQRLFELEQQVKELKLTNSRLRRSTNKLEVDFEARALGNSFNNLPSFSFSKQIDNRSLSKVLNEFDTLEFDQYTEFHQTTRELIETTGDTSAIHNDLENILSNLGLLFDSQKHLVDEMQENLLRLRMVALSSMSARLHRAIRVTAGEEKKLVELNIENENIEVDTQILDAFVEPLIHLLRNAVAHGIEPPETRRLMGKPEKGTVTLKAYSEGTHIVFAISDDGRGISANSLKDEAIRLRFITPKEAKKMSDEEAFSLIFLPGLSTSENINEVSGRGVGMNVVKSSITRRNGDIFISSEPQKGTTFTVRLPMSLAVTRVLLVKAHTQTFAFPLKLVKQIIEISPEEFEKIMREKTIERDGKTYNFFHFNELVNAPVVSKTQNARISLMLLETPDKSCALLVDQLIKPEEVVIKPLNNLLRNVPDIIGATILGDGSIVPVLDLVHLLKRKPVNSEQTKPVLVKPTSEINVLIVDDSPSVRQINSNLVKNAGWQPILARDGLEALEVIQSFQELPDIILTDVEMPKMDGYELLASLKRQENLRQIPVIMITSRSSEKHRRKAFDLGVTDYLTKPFEEWLLIETIKNALEI